VQLLHTRSGVLGRGAPLVLAPSAAVAAELCAFDAGSQQEQAAQPVVPTPPHPFLLDFGRWAGDAALALGANIQLLGGGAPPPPGPVEPWQAQQAQAQRQQAQAQSRATQLSASYRLLQFSVRVGLPRACAAIAEGICRNLQLRVHPQALLHDSDADVLASGVCCCCALCACACVRVRVCLRVCARACVDANTHSLTLTPHQVPRALLRLGPPRARAACRCCTMSSCLATWA
jgi:hypothetical protein